MTRVIDASELLLEIQVVSWDSERDKDMAEDLVLDMPTLPQIGDESLTLEKLERVWRGEWEFEQSKFVNATYGAIKCSRCKKIDTRGDERALKNYRKYTHFCPKCGALMTDEAVQMAMERLEALYGDR